MIFSAVLLVASSNTRAPFLIAAFWVKDWTNKELKSGIDADLYVFFVMSLYTCLNFLIKSFIASSYSRIIQTK
jgi:hypothetical protein